MSLENKIKQNYIYNLIYHILTLIIPLITTPYVSRVIGAELIGLYSYTYAITGYFSIFGLLGAHTYGQLQVSKNRDDKESLSEAFYNTFWCKCFTMIIAITIFLGYILIVKENRKIYLLMLLYLVSCIIDITWFFQGLEEFKTIVIRNIVIRLLSVALIFLLVKTTDDFYLYIIIVLSGGLVGNISLWGRTIKYIHFIKPNINNIILSIKENFVYFIPSIASIVFVSLDKCMIGWLTEGSFENGYYEQANKIYSMLVSFVTAFTVVILPRATYLLNNSHNQEETNRFINQNVNYIGMLVCPICAGLFIIAPTFVPLYFGPGYDECINLLRVFAFIIVFTSFNSIISNQCLIAAGKQGKLNKLLIASSTINVICNYVLIQHYGSLGAVIASCVSECVLLVLLVVNNHTILDTTKLVHKISKYILFSLIMSIAVLAIQTVNIQSTLLLLAIQLLCGIIVYAILLVCSKDELFMKLCHFRTIRKGQ